MPPTVAEAARSGSIAQKRPVRLGETETTINVFPIVVGREGTGAPSRMRAFRSASTRASSPNSIGFAWLTCKRSCQQAPFGPTDPRAR